MRMKRIWINASILIFTAILMLPLSASAKNKFEKEVDLEVRAISLVREAGQGGYDVMTVGELMEMMDAGREMVIIDTMPYEGSYKKAHIPGAKQFLFPIPLMNRWDKGETGGKTEEDFITLLGPDKNRTIVIYCGFVKCTRSHNGALWAVKMGYKNVYRLPGGIFAWKGADYDVEKE